MPSKDELDQKHFMRPSTEHRSRYNNNNKTPRIERCKTYEKLGKCGGICEKCLKTRGLKTPTVEYYKDTRGQSAKK